jgi:hypothetical protein
MNTMDRANHQEKGERKPPKRRADPVPTGERRGGTLPHHGHACQLYRDSAKSGMMPSPAESSSKLVHERSTERL